MAARTRRSNPPKSEVKDSDVATNEALLAHAEFSRSVKSWLSIPAYGDGSEDEENDQVSDKDGIGGRPKKSDGLHGLRAAGEEVTSDMYGDISPFPYIDLITCSRGHFYYRGGLGFIPPKDSTGRPVTTATDPTTTFLRKQLLGRTRPHHPPTSPRTRGQLYGSTNHLPRGSRTGALKDDDSDEEDSRSGLGKARKPQSTSTRASTVKNELVETDPGEEGTQTGSTTGTVEGSKQAKDKTSLDLPPAMLSSRRMKRGTSYLDQVLAERARKKKKKQGKGS
jgi:hypothetical protein